MFFINYINQAIEQINVLIDSTENKIDVMFIKKFRSLFLMYSLQNFKWASQKN